MAGNLTAMIASIFSGGVTADPYYEYTTLLLPGNGTNGAQNNTFLDGSSNNFTITRNGNTTQGTFSPFSQTGWGNYFDGSGDQLSAPNNSVFDFGSGDFTLEFWYFPTAQGQSGYTALLSKFSSSANYAPFSIVQKPSSYDIGFASSSTGSSWNLSSAVSSNFGTMQANAWNHIAVSREGANCRCFLNGSLNQTSNFSTTALMTNTDPVYIGSGNAVNTYATGYISNLRIVKGRAVYTSAFTPPSSPLGITSGGQNPPTGTQTSLLTCQSNRFIDTSIANSGGAFTITVGGNPSVQAFSPFNPTASWSAATNGGSGYFDGNGDYLTAPSNTAFAFGTGAYTVEAWVYLTAFDSASSIIFSAASATNAFNIGVDNNGSFGLSKYGVGGILSTSAGDIKLNSWNHVAVSRNSTSSNDTRLYVNGVLKTTGTDSNDWTVSSAPIVGGFSTFSTYDVIGYLSDLRIVKGTAVYTGAFTPPSLIPLTTAGSTSAAAYPSTTNVNTSFASSATSLLLNFTNAGIYDATSKNDLETVGNAQISTAQSKWGGSSMAFDGTGDWLLIPDQPIQRIGTGNFTVEGWVYRNSSGTYGLIGKGTGTTGWLLSLNSSNQVVFTYGSSTITSTGTVSATTWTHIAVVREGTSTNQTKIYINGTNDGTGTVSTDFNQTNSMYVGADRTGGSAANAYMQDVRVTNYARYTANFTPPTAAFPTL